MRPKTEIDELTTYLDQLIEATRKGSIRWSKGNPTTYFWNAPLPKIARIILQRVTREVAHMSSKGPVSKAVNHHVFQVIHPETANLLFSIETEDREEMAELNSRLETLYEAIESSISRRELNFLKSILPPV